MADKVLDCQSYNTNGVSESDENADDYTSYLFSQEGYLQTSVLSEREPEGDA